MKKLLLAVPVTAVLLLTGCQPAEDDKGGSGVTPGNADVKTVEANWKGLSEQERAGVCKAASEGSSKEIMAALEKVGHKGDEGAQMVPHVMASCP